MARISRTRALAILVLALQGCGLVAYERLDGADGSIRDSGPNSDSGSPSDSGTATDSATDSATATDSGTDAGTDSGTITPGTCTLVPTDDGTTDNYIGTHAVTNATTLYTADDGASYHRAFVRFDVAAGTCAEGGTIPIGATVTGASLELRLIQTCGTCANRPHDLRVVTASWSEASLPAGAGPAVAASAAATFTATSATTTIAVSGAGLTSAVQSMLDTPATNFGFRFAQTSGTSNNATPAGWGSRESANVPRLVVNYQ